MSEIMGQNVRKTGQNVRDTLKKLIKKLIINLYGKATRACARTAFLSGEKTEDENARCSKGQ